MNSKKIFVALFLVVLVFSTFFALSVHILQVQFCGIPMANTGRLCDILNNLALHNYFATAVAGLAVVVVTIFLSLRNAPCVFVSLRTLHSVFPARTTHHAPHIYYWLSLHVNSPNMILARQ